MRRIRFFLALWAGKFLLWERRIRGCERADRPGMAAMILCPDFLEYVAKPKLTICVSGTNGKTTISSVTADLLRKLGKTVSFNDWGANHYAGQARCMLDAVDIFNRPTKDVVIIESDELISPICVPKLKPDYMIVSNLSRDSMQRNAHPEYIETQIQKAAELSPETVMILNADDPLSCFLGKDNRRIYFGVCDQHTKHTQTNADDFTVCHKCGAKAVYHYHNYRHIGNFECSECGLKSPDRDYFVVKQENNTITVREPNGENTYPVISNALHNVYNLAAIIALFRDMGTPAEDIAKHIQSIKLPASRESRETVKGIELITQVAKGQNATAVSTVFENISKDTSEKEIILMLDEVFEDPKKTESISWIYDTDYEFLNDEHIHKIIVGGARYLDHRLRLLLAGIPEEKIVCVDDEYDTAKHVDFDGISKIYILHDVNIITLGRKVKDKIKTRIINEKEEVSV